MTRLSEDVEAAKADFDRDGFTVIRHYFSADELEQLADHVQRYIHEILPTLPAETAYYEDKTRPETLFRLNRMDEHDAYFARLKQNDRFVALSTGLLADAVVPRSVQLFGKAPRIGNPTPPHQDGYYFMLQPNEALTLWLPLDRTDQSNGCIRYVPGSHKRGLRPHGRSAVFGFSQGLLDYGPEDEQAEVAVTVEPGDLIVHHSLTVHRAEANPSDRRRWAVGLVYYAQRAKADAETHRAYHENLIAQWRRNGKL